MPSGIYIRSEKQKQNMRNAQLDTKKSEKTKQNMQQAAFNRYKEKPFSKPNEL